MKELQELRKEGFARVRVDGTVHMLDEIPDGGLDLDGQERLEALLKTDASLRERELYIGGVPALESWILVLRDGGDPTRLGCLASEASASSAYTAARS